MDSAVGTGELRKEIVVALSSKMDNAQGIRISMAIKFLGEVSNRPTVMKTG